MVRLSGLLMQGDVSFIYFCISPPTVTHWCDVGRVTIDVLPDVALLEIFDCYVTQAREEALVTPKLRNFIVCDVLSLNNNIT